MFELNPWIMLGFVLALLGASATGYVKGRIDASASCELERAARERETNEILQRVRDAATAKERELVALTIKTEKQNADQLERINGLRIANGRLIDAAGGLFDKNGRARAPAGGTAAPSDPGGASGGAAGCELSRQVDEDLRTLAYDADRAAVFAGTCKAHVVELYELFDKTCATTVRVPANAAAGPFGESGP